MFVWTPVPIDESQGRASEARRSLGMSHWGARTGYGYEAQRVSFLREMYKTERRHRELSLSPRSDPALSALAASMAISPALASPNRVFASPRPALAAPEVASPSLSNSPSLKDIWPAVSTQAQVQFRPHDAGFLDRFRASKEHGRPHNKDTLYREQVFEMWNVTGVKSPAVFR